MTPEEAGLKVGGHVVYVDPKGVQRDALIQIVWSQDVYPGDYPCINVVVISADSNRQDQYGRQIEHVTSLVHKDKQGAHGNYYMLPGDTPNPYVAPSN